MKNELAPERSNGGFTYKVSVTEDSVSIGDYIFDFNRNNVGADAVFQCDTQFFTDLVNKELKKPLHERKAAKIIASNDPVLNMNGVRGL